MTIMIHNVACKTKVSILSVMYKQVYYLLTRKYYTMSATQMLKGKKLAEDIRHLAKELDIDLSKADDQKTEQYLRKYPSLSKKIVKARKR